MLKSKPKAPDTAKTQGQLDYEADLIAHPLYHDYSPRPTWDNLSEIGRLSWGSPYLNKGA